MLGQILQSLTDAATAEAILAAVGKPEMRERIERAAAVADVPVGTLVSGKLRHLLDHGSEDLWLDLIGAMANTPEPGGAAIERILAHAFPDAVRVRITRPAS